jgi:hypothetical protein
VGDGAEVSVAEQQYEEWTVLVFDGDAGFRRHWPSTPDQAGARWLAEYIARLQPGARIALARTRTLESREWFVGSGDLWS